MGGLAAVFWVVGMILGFVGGIWIVVLAFKESVLWGLGSLFVPFVALIFVILHWDVAKKPFFISLASIPCYILAAVVASSAAG